MSNDAPRSPTSNSPPLPATGDPLDRPLEPPVASIPGVDVDFKAEMGARIIGARIPRPHRKHTGWELTSAAQDGVYSQNDPIDNAAFYAWNEIGGWVYGSGVISAIFYPVAIVRGDWIPFIWGLLALTIIGSPIVALIDGYDHDDVWRRRAAHSLGMATLAGTVVWWGAVTIQPVFAAVYPVVFIASIMQFILAWKPRLRPENRRRLMAAATVLWWVAAASCFAKLIVFQLDYVDDGIPFVVVLCGTFLCVGQAVWFAKAPPPVEPNQRDE